MGSDRDAGVTRAIIMACVLIQLAATIGGAPFAAMFGIGGGLIPARLAGGLLIENALPAPVTLVTSIFLHSSWAHLGFNMIFLFWVGRFTEALLGNWRYLVLFFVTGIAGGLVQVAMDPSSTLPVVGASGAISGVFAAHAMYFGRSGGKGELVRAVQLGAVWIGLQLATGFVFGDTIAIGAHVGGFLAGLAIALPLARSAIAEN